MHIIWLQPSNNIAVTTIIDGSDPEIHAELLRARGDIPPDWVTLATGMIELPQAWPQLEDWVWKGDGIVVDFPRAQESTKCRLRQERAPLLAALDVQFQRALETGADASAIIAEKQRLRDITKLTDGAITLDDLRALSCQPAV